jgi:regulator of RNase E activity RraA
MTTTSNPTDLFAGLPTAAISDALDKLGLPGALDGIRAITHQGTAVCGPAYTVSYEPVGAQHGTVGDFLDDVPHGAVIVIDNRARTDCTVWGGIMTRVAHHRGIAATVINGVCRDTTEAGSVTYPIWAAGSFMRTGKDRVRLAAVQVPVTIGTVAIRPDDIVCADSDGAVVVPAAHAGPVARIARQINDVEDAIIASVLSGATLAQARADHGYHRLQTATRTAN